MQSQAELYDLQGNEWLEDVMTYPSPLTGESVGTSFLRPTTKEDLEKRRLMIKEWAKHTHGLMGRSPDYMNTALMVMQAAAELLSKQDPQFAINIRNYYEYCRENDSTITHTFIQPQMDRSKGFMESQDQPLTARIVKKTAEGIVLEGALLLATQGGITDEILIFPTLCPPSPTENNPFAYALALPSNTPGMKFVCRQRLQTHMSQFDNPLSAKLKRVMLWSFSIVSLCPGNVCFYVATLRLRIIFLWKETSTRTCPPGRMPLYCQDRIHSWYHRANGTNHSNSVISPCTGKGS
jgi:4-hydroxyphenylacetate 3-monooxygenase